MSAVATLQPEESQEQPETRTFEALKDGLIVQTVMGIGEDHKGKAVEITKSVVARQGDEFNNLSKATLDAYDAGQLNSKLRELDPFEIEERENAEAEGSGEPELKYADVKEYDGLSNDVLDEILAERSLTDSVVGSGKDNSIVKQDRIKALIENDKRSAV